MAQLIYNSQLYLDFYELTMAQGYFRSKRHTERVSFDYFFRNTPFKGGYVIFAGLADVIKVIKEFRFYREDLLYLSSLGFDDEFLEYLKSFEFKGTIYAMREGEVVFPLEPIVRISGNLVECQIMETLILNLLNYESLVATKASRIRQVVGPEAAIIDFGMRRAQGLGSIHASRAAVIGGVNATSNVHSAMKFGLEVSGTQAHSWIQSFESELDAFRNFTLAYPESSVLLVDTYDTLHSGVPNAIIVGKEMEERGNRLLGIRLDSGDLAYLSKKARAMLDDAGLSYVQIAASNQLDEYVIKSLLEEDAPIDVFGIGTNLITAKPDATLDGVYKLASIQDRQVMKLSDHMAKTTLPGEKKVVRFIDKMGYFYADGIGLREEDWIDLIYHPYEKTKFSRCALYEHELLLEPVLVNGELSGALAGISEAAAYATNRLQQLTSEHKRFLHPHIYKVGISEQLWKLRDTLRNSILDSYKKEKDASDV